MKLTAQEEYGLRCLLQVARRASGPDDAPVSIRDISVAEGLSIEYAGKLMRVLRIAGLVESERGTNGGYRLARPASEISLADVLASLDSPMVTVGFCEAHRGHRESCVHLGGCSLRPVWQAIEAAVAQVMRGLYLSDLLCGERTIRERVTAEPMEG